jgi:hypothetical protein
MARFGKEQREKVQDETKAWMASASETASVFRVACFLPFHPLRPLPPSLSLSFSDSRHRQSRGGNWPAGSNAASALVKDGPPVVQARALCGRREGAMFDAAGFLCGISALWCFGVEGIGCCEPPGRLG